MTLGKRADGSGAKSTRRSTRRLEDRRHMTQSVGEDRVDGRGWAKILAGTLKRSGWCDCRCSKRVARVGDRSVLPRHVLLCTLPHVRLGLDWRRETSLVMFCSSFYEDTNSMSTMAHPALICISTALQLCPPALGPPPFPLRAPRPHRPHQRIHLQLQSYKMRKSR